MTVKNNFIFILSAGKSERTIHQAFTKKQYIYLGDYPTFIWAMNPFLDYLEQGFQIVLVYPKDSKILIRNLLYKHLHEDVASQIVLIEGGVFRCESVYYGILGIEAQCHHDSIILIHDAARPFVEKKDIANLVDQLQTNANVSLSHDASDTLLYAKNQYLNRNQLNHLTTPQGFHLSILKEAYVQFYKQNNTTTDDTQLLTQLGYSPLLIRGSRCNFKISYPEDIALAQAYAQHLQSTHFSSKFFKKRL